MKHLIYIAIILSMAGTFPAIAQIAFTVPDTICAEEEFTALNQSRTNATSYFWHFCSANLSYSPSVANLGSMGQLIDPAFMDFAKENGQYYGFVTNHNSGNITRLQFGNSLLNTPTPYNMGNFKDTIPLKVEGIQVVQDSANGNWYAFIIGGLGDDDRLVRLDFGSSLLNNPKPINLGNIGNLDFPVDLYLFKENNTWLGFTVNYLSNSITRFNFGNDLSNPPSAVNLGNIGNLNRPFGICPVKSNGSWHFFITNSGTNSLTRLDFGSSLLTNPTGTNLGSVPKLNNPYDIAIINDCEHAYGFVASTFNSSMVQLNFPEGITGRIEYLTVNNGSLSQPHGISKVYREDNEIFVFVTDVANGTLNRLYYSTCTEPSILTSNAQSPPAVFYRNPGNYNISLILDQGLLTEEFTCRNIVVKEKPQVSLGNDTTICPKTRLILYPKEDYYAYLWNNGQKNNSYDVDTAGIYWLEVTNNKGCKDRDSIQISDFPDNLWLGNDTTYVLGESITLNAGIYSNYEWSTGQNTQTINIIKPGDYAVLVKDLVYSVSGTNLFCIFTDTIRVDLQVDYPNFFTPNNDGYNDTWQPRLLFHYPEAELFIYNRHGLLIASLRGSDGGWDGTSNGKPVMPDTYWFILDLKDGSKPIRGSLTIKR